MSRLIDIMDIRDAIKKDKLRVTKETGYFKAEEGVERKYSIFLEDVQTGERILLYRGTLNE